MQTSRESSDLQDQDIDNDLRKIGSVLPVTFPILRFTKHHLKDVMASVDQEISAEVVIRMKENIDEAVLDTIDDVCEVPNTHIYGCYSSKKGARATVQCSSTTASLSAEVRCDKNVFTIPCSPNSEGSVLRFLLSTARVRLICSVTCGSRNTTFEITGILKYIHTLQGQVNEMAIPAHNITSDFEWPDFSHILDVYLQWYKTVVLTVLAVGLALLLSYYYLTTACGRLLHKVVRTACYIIRGAVRMTIAVGTSICKLCVRQHHVLKQQKVTPKLL
ncbi:unnamed protein product [Nippostrongylus brasiliensis]|uniref:Phlebovirus_G2 domain-containing protein n=1 Tax=Nippostrongylus brasiliensis TaxID=27835 RepID=A0A0N4YJA8_NIPBR|nr:unnamed protein product [Nippostrongylus brasiliensis]